MVGRLLLTGRPASAVTTALGGEVAGAELPASLVAMTTTRSVLPTSASLSVYVPVVAPLMAAQLAPLESQRFQA